MQSFKLRNITYLFYVSFYHLYLPVDVTNQGFYFDTGHKYVIKQANKPAFNLLTHTVVLACILKFTPDYPALIKDD